MSERENLTKYPYIPFPKGSIAYKCCLEGFRIMEREGYHKLPTPDSKKYRELLLTQDEQNEHYNDSGLIEDAHWMIDDLLKAQIDKVLALLGGKE